MLISQSVIINVERAFNTASQRKLKQRWYRTCKTRRGQKCRKLCTSTFFNTWPQKRERFIHSALLFERKWNKRRTEPDGLADKGNQGNGAGLCSQRWQLLEMCVIDYIYCFFLVQLQSGWGICIRHKCIGIISTHPPKLSLSSWIVVFSIAPPRPTVQEQGCTAWNPALPKSYGMTHSAPWFINLESGTFYCVEKLPLVLPNLHWVYMMFPKY